MFRRRKAATQNVLPLIRDELFKQRHRLDDRRPDAPRKRNADEQPEREHDSLMTALTADRCGIATDRVCRCLVVREFAFGFQFCVGHEPFRSHRAHQQVADKAAN